MELLAQWLWVGMSDYGGKVEDNGVGFFFLFSFFLFCTVSCWLWVVEMISSPPVMGSSSPFKGEEENYHDPDQRTPYPVIKFPFFSPKGLKALKRFLIGLI